MTLESSIRRTVGRADPLSMVNGRVRSTLIPNQYESVLSSVILRMHHGFTKVSERSQSKSQGVRPLVAQSALSYMDVVKSGMTRLEAESQAHPEWFDDFDVADTSSYQEMAELFDSAPGEFTKGMIYGRLSLMLHMSSFTGRPMAHAPSDESRRKMMDEVDGRMKVIDKTYPDWFIEFDSTDPDFCSRSELEQMFMSAPTDFSSGMLFGKMTAKIQMTPITGRPFYSELS